MKSLDDLTQHLRSTNGFSLKGKSSAVAFKRLHTLHLSFYHVAKGAACKSNHVQRKPIMFSERNLRALRLRFHPSLYHCLINIKRPQSTASWQLSNMNLMMFMVLNKFICVQVTLFSLGQNRPSAAAGGQTAISAS